MFPTQNSPSLRYLSTSSTSPRPSSTSSLLCRVAEEVLSMPMPDLARGHVYALVPTRSQGWSCSLSPTTEIQGSAHSHISLDPCPKTSKTHGLGGGRSASPPTMGPLIAASTVSAHQSNALICLHPQPSPRAKKGEKGSPPSSPTPPSATHCCCLGGCWWTHQAPGTRWQQRGPWPQSWEEQSRDSFKNSGRPGRKGFAFSPPQLRQPKSDTQQ